MRVEERQLRAWMIGGLDGIASDYTCLLRELVPLLRTFYRRRMTVDLSDIEDMVQDTLIAIHTRRATYDRGRPFTPWLFSIARYKMIDHHRRARRTVPIDGLEEILITEGFEEALSAKVDVNALLETLPAKQARLIRATRLEGASVADVAAADSIGLSDVKVSVHRGIKALAAKVAGQVS
jgi:RNA polymerase sigma factor (sigma-70 family)